ncbi:unnamed protein product [Strongylus vulgaris]|uniref:CUB domain-containing protein n=1 Tax=Strongylus vulgaris TaxID=40348 RepID=A0A3P7JDV2_STRVU|nr:unnamed protein product [Strongylus vulgaris]
MTNPNNCAGCVCPGGYGGTLCNQRPAGCGETLAATDRWQVERFTFGNAQIATLRDTFVTCNYWITAPLGRQIQVRVTWMEEPKCGTGCRVNSIEPKFKADQRATNPR